MWLRGRVRPDCSFQGSMDASHRREQHRRREATKALIIDRYLLRAPKLPSIQSIEPNLR